MQSRLNKIESKLAATDAGKWPRVVAIGPVERLPAIVQRELERVGWTGSKEDYPGEVVESVVTHISLELWDWL